MAVLTLPHQSRTTIFVCVSLQLVALYGIVTHEQRNLWLLIPALFIGGFVTDLISGMAHFGFDYVWQPSVPILGPVAVEFRQHHESPTLDPAAILTNFSKAAYGALPCALIAVVVGAVTRDTIFSFVVDSTLFWISVWMLGFHQIHSYAHMGSKLPPDEFNRAVAAISNLPSRKQQKREFARLFDDVGIPPLVRLLQRSGLFLRPEVHWRHHQSFDSDFSSVNGWSDPVTNWFYGPIARREQARRTAATPLQHA